MAKKRKKPTIRITKRKKVAFNPRRNILDPAYIKWREAVYERDGFTCRWCKRKKKHINAHHIRRWATFPSLRFMVSNGITLCAHCHGKVKNKEEEYAPFFLTLLTQQLLSKIKDAIQKR